MEEKHYDDENTIIELSSVSEDTLFDESVNNEETLITEEEIKVTPKKNKKKKDKKEFIWKRLSKKGKIITIVVAILLLLAITGLLLYFFVFKKDDTPKENKESIVIEKDNYIYDNGKLKLLDNKDKVIGIYTCIDADAEKCYVASFTEEDEFDTPKYVDEDDNALLQKSKIYNDRFVFIYDDEKIVLYDIEEESKSGEYSLIKKSNFIEDIVVAKTFDDKYGLIEFTSSKADTVLDFEYEYLGIINSNETFVAKEGTYSYLIDKEGKALTSLIRGNIRNFSEKYMAVYESDYSLYDYQGQKVLEDTYDFIDFAGNYVLVINAKKLFVYDNQLSKLNEAGVKLKSDNYNKIYVFDEDNNLKETKKAYNVTFTSGAITFELSDETEKSINLYEVALNKKNDYVSYLDGVLYFYSDLEKKELLGSYNCSNDNEVVGSSTSFENCFVAMESNIVNDNVNLGYLPIINENYVFIKDTKKGATKENIVLYDLANNAQKVKYQAVDSGISSDDITFVTSQNGLIFAKNSEGNLGVITFTNDGPQGLIPFKVENEGTESISYFKDNYLLVKRGDNNYLYTKIGELKATSKFDIKDYRGNYLLVKDKKYLVYEMAGSDSGSIISESLDHVELFDNFFVGIKDKKLNVYNYSDGKTKLLAEDLTITNKKVEDGYTLAIHSDCYTISIKQGNNATVDYKYKLQDWSPITNEEE